jgi:hypothetical protein
VLIPTPVVGRKLSPREAWPQFIDIHNELHKLYRSRGGQITFIMGQNAKKAYENMRRPNLERIDTERLEFAEAFEVWVERSRTVDYLHSGSYFQTASRNISRIVIFGIHPSYLRFRKTSATVTMDNACNFAAALAGMAPLFKFDYFTRTLKEQVTYQGYSLLIRCSVTLHRRRLEGQGDRLLRLVRLEFRQIGFCYVSFV